MAVIYPKDNLTQIPNYSKPNDTLEDRRRNEEGYYWHQYYEVSGKNLYMIIWDHEGGVFNNLMYEGSLGYWTTYGTGSRANYCFPAAGERADTSKMYYFTIPQTDVLMRQHGGGMVIRNVKSFNVFIFAQAVDGVYSEADPLVAQHRWTLEWIGVDNLYGDRVSFHRPRSVVNESVDSWPMDGTVNSFSFPMFRRIGQYIKSLGRK